MITRYRAWMDGRPLDGVDDAVCILDIIENAPMYLTETAAPARGDGLQIKRHSRQSLSVTISLAIREQDVARRKAIAGRINAWAQGAYLSINDRPGQRIACIVTQALAVTSALKWTETLRLTFTAYESPWWEAAFADSARLTEGTYSTGVLPLTGDMGEAKIEASVEALADCNTLTLTCGNTALRFEGLGMKGQETLHVRYVDGVQRITITGESGERGVLAKRTPDSSDDLLAASGAVTQVGFAADGTVRVVFSGRGRFA